MHLETTDDGKKLVEQITNHIEGMNLIFFNNLTGLHGRFRYDPSLDPYWLLFVF